MFKDSRIHASARLTIVEGTAHRAHGAWAARSGNSLAGAPRRALSLEARDDKLRFSRAPWAVLSAIIGREDVHIQLSLNINISLIIASIAK